MAISFVADNEYGLSANATSQTVTIPTGWTDGDLLVLITVFGSQQAPHVGWRQLHVEQLGSGLFWSVSVRRATTGDSTWSISFASSERGCLWIGCYTGGAVQGELSSEALTNSTSMASSLGIPANEGLVLYAGAVRRSGTPNTLATTTGTTRATITSAVTTNETVLVVSERSVSSYESPTLPTWTTSNSPAVASHLQFGLLDTDAPGGLMDTWAFASAASATSWVYKGRANKTDDTTGAA